MDKLIIVSFSIFTLLTSFRVISALVRGNNIAGSPPISKSLFVISKICVFITIIYPFFKSIGFSFKLFPIDYMIILSQVGACLYILGIGLFTVSIYTLRFKALKFGLSKEKTVLQTKGVYGISRNPIYLSIYIIFSGAILYSQNIFILICVVISAYIHNKIIISEEQFLENELGVEWELYRSKVRRYL